MIKLVSIKTAIVTSFAVVALSSCSTYQNLATQWKYRSDYKNPGVTEYAKVKTTENFHPTIETPVQVAEEQVVAVVSNEEVNAIVEKNPTILETKKIVKHRKLANYASVSPSETTISASELKTIKKDTKKEVAITKENGGKIKIVAFLLGFFLGIFGIHRFYLGGKTNTTNGIIQLILSVLVVTLPISYVWSVIDWIRILLGKLKPGSGDYV